MAAEGMRPTRDDMIVTTGGQQALDLIAKALIDPGDVVIAEGPTYPGAVPVFCSYEADTRQVADGRATGCGSTSSRSCSTSSTREGRRPKFIYSVPTFQNPGGVTMSLERRRRLVEIAREREMLVVEDNPYGLLRYEGEALPTLYSLDGGDYVLYIGTFSKILSPGIRIGWALRAAAGDGEARARQAGRRPLHLDAEPVLRRASTSARAAGSSTSASSRGSTASRRDAMLEALERYFPAQATWSRPEGGLFVWATLPDYIDTTDLLAKALRENVAFVPGEAAFVDGRGSGSMRLNFSAQTEDEIREGIRRIGAVVAEQVEPLRDDDRRAPRHRPPRRAHDPSRRPGEVLPFRPPRTAP